MTTINIYHLDDINDDNKLQYNFKSNYDFEKPAILENVSLHTDYYRRIIINRDDKNITYKSEVYAFNGFYISKYSDIITTFNDENNEDNYYLIIETRNIATLKNRSYLYLYIPIKNNPDDTSDFGDFINGFGEKNEHIVYSYNFNDLIPDGKFVYYTKKNNINGNERTIDNIIFNTSNLTADLNNLTINSHIPTENIINNPLLLNDGPPIQIEYITGQIDNDIYIDCSPVDDINPEEEYIIPKKNNTVTMKYFFGVIFVILFVAILSYFEFYSR